MALIECGECGAEVSDKAAACVKCGAPIAIQPEAVEVDENGYPVKAGARAGRSNVEPKHYGCGSLILVGFVLVVVWGMLSPYLERTGTDSSAAKKEALVDSYKRVVYFKSASRDRIIVLKALKLTEAGAKSAALMEPYTPGQMTAVYVYGQGKRTPGNVLNTYGGVLQVNKALYNAGDIDGWDYVLMRYRNGNSDWFACAAGEVSEFCRG